MITAKQIRDIIERLNGKALQYAMADSPDATGEELAEIQTEFFIEDFEDWFRELGTKGNQVVDELVENAEVRNRLVELCDWYSVVDLFGEMLDESEAELFEKEE